MGLFAKDSAFQVVRQGDESILEGNFEGYPKLPSLEDDDAVMAMTVEELLRNPTVTKIVFAQKHDYEYDRAQTALLKEVALLYGQLAKAKDLYSLEALSAKGLKDAYSEVHRLLLIELKSDPIGCYVELHRLVRKIRIALDRALSNQEAAPLKAYLALLSPPLEKLEGTGLIQAVKDRVAGIEVGDRALYKRVFIPSIKPDFMYTKLQATSPTAGEEIHSYSVGGAEVIIFRLPDTIRPMYHVIPPEFKLTEEKYEVLDTARGILAEHKPQRQEFVDPDRMRDVFAHVGRDLLEELLGYQKLRLSEEEIQELTEILLRYTVGFGLIEILLADPKIQDITANSPFGAAPLFVVHEDFGECHTNIVPTILDSQSWASKLRLLSGRPLDEANPILDTELHIPDVARARVGVINEPLNPQGTAYAFRRHRDKPWTLPLFIKNRMITPLGAGVLSFLIDGNRTFLIAGTRSAGKTSFLAALMVEIMRKYRVLTIEDTLELPVAALRGLGYNIQPMKVASALAHGTSEVPADIGIRTTLRLGDSALIIVEVRSTEARALNEAMRVGALANTVAGTIHGDSPYGVFDRVVNDLGVPRTSFKASDVIVVANPIKSADGLHKWRRITRITEVRKAWTDDPLAEGGFADLLKYDPKTDELLPTDELLHGESEVLKGIAGSVREFAGNWDSVWDNIQLRAKIKELLVQAAEAHKRDDLLEAPFVVLANDAFHRAVDAVQVRTGRLDTRQILFEWQEWLKRSVRSA